MNFYYTNQTQRQIICLSSIRIHVDAGDVKVFALGNLKTVDSTFVPLKQIYFLLIITKNYILHFFNYF